MLGPKHVTFTHAYFLDFFSFSKRVLVCRNASPTPKPNPNIAVPILAVLEPDLKITRDAKPAPPGIKRSIFLFSDILSD